MMLTIHEMILAYRWMMIEIMLKHFIGRRGRWCHYDFCFGFARQIHVEHLRKTFLVAKFEHKVEYILIVSHDTVERRATVKVSLHLKTTWTTVVL